MPFLKMDNVKIEDKSIKGTIPSLLLSNCIGNQGTKQNKASSPHGAYVLAGETDTRLACERVVRTRQNERACRWWWECWLHN